MVLSFSLTNVTRSAVTDVLHAFANPRMVGERSKDPKKETPNQLRSAVTQLKTNV